MIQKPFEVRSVSSFRLRPSQRANAASAQVVEPVPVREFPEAPAVVVAGTDELVRVMSFATSDSLAAMIL